MKMQMMELKCVFEFIKSRPKAKAKSSPQAKAKASTKKNAPAVPEFAAAIDLDELDELSAVLGFLGSKPNRPQPKPKAKGKARAMQATRPQEESETVDPAPTVLDPESERKPLFTSDGEDEHHLFCAGPPKAVAKAKAMATAKAMGTAN